MYLACKAYWADNGSDQECNVSIASQPEVGYIKSDRINIEGHGTEKTFSATAFHEEGDEVYKMDVNGSIELLKSRTAEKKDPNDWLRNIKDNLRYNYGIKFK